MAGPEGPAYMRKDGYFMKAMKRRLLSLLLAMAMVCSLVPTALAADELTVGVSVTNSTAQAVDGKYPLGATVTLTANVTAGYDQNTDGTLSYEWTGATPVNSNPSTATVTSASATTISVSCKVTATKSNEGADPTIKTGTSSSVAVAFAEAQQTPVATDMSITPASVTLTMGSKEEQTLSASVTGTGGTLSQNATYAIKSGSPTDVVSVSGNKVTALKAGNTIIVATSEAQNAAGNSLTKEVPVTVNPAVGSVDITLGTTSIPIGGTGTVAIATPATGVDVSGSTISWKQSAGTGKVSITGTNTNTVTVVGQTAGSVTLTVTYMNGNTKVAEGSRELTVEGAPQVYFGVNNINTPRTTLDLSGAGSEATLYVYVGGQTNQYAGYSYNWQILSGSSVNVQTGTNFNNYAQTIRAVTAGTTRIRVTVSNNNTPVGSADITVTVGSSDLLISATVDGYSDYLFSDTDANGNASVYTQIYNAVSNTSINRRLYSVTFLSTTSVYGDIENATAYNGIYYADNNGNGARLSQLVFSPRQAGTARFNFYAYYSDWNSTTPTQNSYLTGTLEIKVDNTVTTGDIPYTASIGDDVPFDIGDFEDFYYSKTSRGTLEYVTFSMPSGGYLYSDRSRLSASNATCYVSPRSTQNDLGSVYFSPSGTTASKAGTVRVNFTAYGNRNGNSGVSGTVAITYLNGAAKDISYSTVGGSVTLDPQDFIDAYKEVTGKTAPSNLTIQFQEVPANGTLTYTGGSRDVDLTKSNVRSNKYSTKTTGTYRLNQLTYTGTKGKDTVAYIAYNGSTAQFTGNVVFNGTAAVPTDVVVTYGSTGGQAVVFSQNDFIRANSVMSNAVKVRFVTPANGTLTMNGSSAAGIDVATSLLGSVTYKPKAGFNNNTDRITFVAYDSRNQLVASGSVNITVVGNTSTTTTPGGVTDVSQFKDVSANAWYRNDLDTLVKAGVITGKGEGKFDPKGTVTYGEALKMVLEACNHTATVGTGSQWAINYKNLAVSRGWISSSIDLNAPITRNATAELAAKVMGVAPATSGSPFADEANAYAVALYYTNPQIFYGTTNPNGGKPLFENNKPLLREQVCAVICRVRTYNAQQTTDTMPDGI